MLPMGCDRFAESMLLHTEIMAVHILWKASAALPGEQLHGGSFSCRTHWVEIELSVDFKLLVNVLPVAANPLAVVKSALNVGGVQEVAHA